MSHSILNKFVDRRLRR